MKTATMTWCIEGECHVEYSAIESEDELLLLNAALPFLTDAALKAESNTIWIGDGNEEQVIGGEFGLVFDGQPQLVFRDISGRIFMLVESTLAKRSWILRPVIPLTDEKSLDGIQAAE